MRCGTSPGKVFGNWARMPCWKRPFGTTIACDIAAGDEIVAYALPAGSGAVERGPVRPFEAGSTRAAGNQDVSMRVAMGA